MLFSLTRSNNNNKRNNTDCRVNFFLSFVLVSNDYPSLIFVFLEIFFFFFVADCGKQEMDSVSFGGDGNDCDIGLWVGYTFFLGGGFGVATPSEIKKQIRRLILSRKKTCPKRWFFFYYYYFVFANVCACVCAWWGGGVDECANLKEIGHEL